MESDTQSTYDLSLLDQSRFKWSQSEAIRIFYKDLYAQLLQLRIHGTTLEIGSGCGFIKEHDPEIKTSDVEKTPYVDLAASAYDLQQLDLEWNNIIAVDVLHHLTEPIKFFKSASKAISNGGRILLCEPAATAFGSFFYQNFHHEPCIAGQIVPPFSFTEDESGFFANMGMGIALFRDKLQDIKEILSKYNLHIKSICYRDTLAYPLTGGFSKPSLLPSWGINVLLHLEKCLPEIVMKKIGLRMIIVLEKDDK